MPYKSMKNEISPYQKEANNKGQSKIIRSKRAGFLNTTLTNSSDQKGHRLVTIAGRNSWLLHQKP